MKYFIALAAMSILSAMAVSAADSPDTSSQDKSQYNFFNPTPPDLMRPINSAQFDNVLDAHTLDAGHFQVEGSLLNYYTYADQHYFVGLSYRTAEEEYSWAPRFRVGLLNNVDFEINPTYLIRSQNQTGAFTAPFAPYAFNTTAHSSGFGTLGLGPRLNLWGNDDGPTALAIHPFLSVPTRNGQLLGGTDIPFSLQMPRGLYLKLDSEIYLVDNSVRTIYGAFFNSISLHKTVCSKADAYWYLDATVISQSGQSWFGYTGFGVLCKLTPDLQLFGGIGFGLDSGAYDYNPRFGVVTRF